MSNSKMHYYRCCWQSYGHLFPKMGLNKYFINDLQRGKPRADYYSWLLFRRIVSEQFASLLPTLVVLTISQVNSPESISRSPLASMP